MGVQGTRPWDDGGMAEKSGVSESERAWVSWHGVWVPTVKENNGKKGGGEREIRELKMEGLLILLVWFGVKCTR